jgi:hypothetical protein
LLFHYSNVKNQPTVSDTHYRKCAEFLEKGYEIGKTDGSINTAGFIPLEGKQPSSKLFEIDHTDRDVLSFMYSADYFKKAMSGESLAEFATESSVQLGYSQQGKIMKMTAGVSVSSGLGFTAENRNLTIYNLHHEEYKFGFMNFDVETARNRLTPSARAELSNVKDASSATYVMSKYGVGYINQLTLGAQFETSCSIEKSHFMTKSDVETAVESKVSAGKKSASEGNVGIDMSVETNGRTSNTTLFTKARGGDITLLSQDMEAWKRSAAENPSVIGYDVEPLYSLFKPSEPAYPHLRAVFDKMVEEFPLPPDRANLAKENYYISVTQHEDWMGYTRSADIKLCYSNTKNVIQKVTKNRNDFFRWRNKVRQPGSNFALKNITDVKIVSDQRIDDVEDIPRQM